MTLTVDPAERALHHTHLAIGDEPRRQKHSQPGDQRPEPTPSDVSFDAAAPVGVDPGTGAAVADLHAVDAVPLTVVLSRYGEAT